jgi:hypothetical protein
MKLSELLRKRLEDTIEQAHKDYATGLSYTHLIGDIEVGAAQHVYPGATFLSLRYNNLPELMEAFHSVPFRGGHKSSDANATTIKFILESGQEIHLDCWDSICVIKEVPLAPEDIKTTKMVCQQTALLPKMKEQEGA